MNDPKYITGTIINSASGEAIPQDEPVFIFRARDTHAATILAFYLELIEDDANSEEHHRAVEIRYQEFIAFRNGNPQRMKVPDTDLSNQGMALTKLQRNEMTGDEVGAIAARLIRHHDPEVRRLAASALTQRPDNGETAHS